MPEPFRDPALSVDERVADLLPRMSIREKVGQLNQRLLGWRTWGSVGASFAITNELATEVDRWGGAGAIYGILRADAWSGQDWSNGVGPQASAELAALVQERVVAASPHGIPALFVEEAPHGHQALGAQLFPTNIAVAASWRPDLLTEAAAHVGRELRARGVHLALVSGLDILRDPRWGRSEECFGEDPLLASLFTRSLVRGLSSAPGLGVVLKHFAGQGAGIGGRNSSGAPLGCHEIAEIHLPAAHAGLDEGAIGVMAAYNDLDGLPCIANRWLLTDVLRHEWGFRGIVMADMLAIDRLIRTVDSSVDAAALALRAGVDLSLSDDAYQAIEEGVEDGRIPIELIDRACGRVLRAKVELGLLDPPAPLPTFPPPNPADDLVAATPVLLTNRGGVLPLPARPGRVVVIGPNADDLDSLLGDYVPPLPDGTGTTILAGVRDRLGSTVVAHEAGAGLVEPIDGGLARAAEAAANADIAIVVLGGSSRRAYDDPFTDNGAGMTSRAPTFATSGEGYDVAEVRLPGPQRALLDTVARTGTTIIAIVVSGRPLGIETVAAQSSAVLWASFPGPDGGRAIAEILFGDREPVGRLPASLPCSSGILPVAYDERVETVTRYVDGEAAPTFSFGAGLGYTTWVLGRTTIEPASLRLTPRQLLEVRVSACLTNTGARPGRQLVQLYARARVPGVLPRRAVLLGYTEAMAESGQEVTATVTISPDAIPGLGLPDTGGCAVELWLSLDGPGEPEWVTRLDVG